MTSRLLLDTPTLVYRAFFALPTSIRAPSGQSVNAVRGVLEMITLLYTTRGPAEVIACFDADWRPASRVAAYAGYKAQRAEDPEELPPQFPILVEMLDALGIARAEAPALEADDAIATLSQETHGDDRAWIVTGDRDLLALVRDPHVQLLFTVKGVREVETFDERAVQTKYGVTPAQYTEFAMLRGDPSDGLPGVPGIGPVKAAALIAAHGSIEAVQRTLPTLTPKLRATLTDARDYLEAMRSVVPMVTDATLTRTTTRPPDEARVLTLATHYGVVSAAQRLLAVRRTGP